MVTETASSFPLGSSRRRMDPNLHDGLGRGELEMSLLDPTRDREWDRLVLTHPRSNFFHGSAWARVLMQTYGHRPYYLHFSKNGCPVALLPLLEVSSAFTGRRAVSLPFSDFCGPLVFSGADLTSLLEPIKTLARQQQWRHVELRGGDELEKREPSSIAFYGHTLDLRGGVEEIFSRFNGSVRRAIRKSENSALSIHLERSLGAIEAFRALHARTRRRHGLPPQSAEFFRQIHEHILAPGLGFIALVRNGKRAVAAAIFFVWGTKAIYKFGASDESAQNLRGNNLAMWETIRFLVGEGVRDLDLGRTAPENEGLRRFKLGWGTKERTIHYRQFKANSGKWTPIGSRNAGIASHLFGRMPLALNQLAGRLLYPHLD